jgi:hypothetical protein
MTSWGMTDHIGVRNWYSNSIKSCDFNGLYGGGASEESAITETNMENGMMGEELPRYFAYLIECVEVRLPSGRPVRCAWA